MGQSNQLLSKVNGIRKLIQNMKCQHQKRFIIKMDDDEFEDYVGTEETIEENNQQSQVENNQQSQVENSLQVVNGHPDKSIQVHNQDVTKEKDPQENKTVEIGNERIMFQVDSNTESANTKVDTEQANNNHQLQLCITNQLQTQQQQTLRTQQKQKLTHLESVVETYSFPIDHQQTAIIENDIFPIDHQQKTIIENDTFPGNQQRAIMENDTKQVDNRQPQDMIQDLPQNHKEPLILVSQKNYLNSHNLTVPQDFIGITTIESDLIIDDRNVINDPISRFGDSQTGAIHMKQDLVALQMQDLPYEQKTQSNTDIDINALTLDSLNTMNQAPVTQQFQESVQQNGVTQYEAQSLELKKTHQILQIIISEQTHQPNCLNDPIQDSNQLTLEVVNQTENAQVNQAEKQEDEDDEFGDFEDYQQSAQQIPQIQTLPEQPFIGSNTAQQQSSNTTQAQSSNTIPQQSSNTIPQQSSNNIPQQSQNIIPQQSQNNIQQPLYSSFNQQIAQKNQYLNQTTIIKDHFYQTRTPQHQSTTAQTKSQVQDTLSYQIHSQIPNPPTTTEPNEQLPQVQPQQLQTIQAKVQTVPKQLTLQDELQTFINSLPNYKRICQKTFIGTG